MFENVVIHSASLKTILQPGVVAHTFNPSTQEAEAGGFLSSRPAWSTE
jgi:major histocompatibility complex class I